ncbi:MAG: aminomethyl-transferring glycine dehydrogenase subunit GcvPA [Asgard group archaeon]|nr:aminomethyl-transferring glycine dehydrogenase subunit GcvPA [Asgard group archaeon]
MSKKNERSANDIQKEMESYLKIESVDELFSDIPDSIRLKKKLKIPAGLSERDLSLYVDEVLSLNQPVVSFLGGGTQNHYIPAIVQEVMNKPELLNSYTPYQPEVAQGMLQGLFEYQSLINELTGMNVTNASMYDWATATAEALLMAVRLLKNRTKVLITTSIHPDRLAVIKNYLAGPKINFELVNYNQETGELDLADLKMKLSEDVAAFYFETPNNFGVIESQSEEICKLVHDVNAKAIVGVDPISLGIYRPPGEFGADIAVGEGQGLGNPMCFGGPHFGFFSVNYDRKLIRQMPGRLVGLTKTEDGKQRAFVLTLSTREQHIRREKATSNICTNQSILAFGAGVYLSLLGAKGLKETAEYCLSAAHYLAVEIDKLTHFEAPIFKGSYYNEFVMRITKGKMAKLETKLIENGIVGGYTLEKCHPELGEAAIFCVTEMHTMNEIDKLLKILQEFDKELGGK